MKLSVIFPVFNQFPLATTALDIAMYNLSGKEDVEVIVLDNGSAECFYCKYKEEYDKKLPPNVTFRGVKVDKNIGVYPTFWWGLQEAKGDVLAFFHSDLMVTEKNWDERVLYEFKRDTTLGLLGFIGSNEIDSSGGRGSGTTSNFQGNDYKNGDGLGSPSIWRGSPAEAHGRKSRGYSRATVVDGCSMVFRRSVLEQIKQRENFPPHHFYDRLLSSEVRELGYTMEVLGIECDHISGQTVNQEPGYNDMAKEWADSHGLTMDSVHNWDSVLYREAERQWLKEYRDEKRLVPCKV